MTRREVIEQQRLADEASDAGEPTQEELDALTVSEKTQSNEEAKSEKIKTIYDKYLDDADYKKQVWESFKQSRGEEFANDFFKDLEEKRNREIERVKAERNGNGDTHEENNSEA